LQRCGSGGHALRIKGFGRGRLNRATATASTVANPTNMGKNLMPDYSN
jgi:hypothetical protein